MTNALSAVRTSLVETVQQINDELLVFSVIPEAVTPPFVYVSPGDPYVSRDDTTFGGERVRCNVGVVAAPGANDIQAEALDAMVLDVIDVLEDSDFEVVDVEQPGRIAINGQPHLAASIQVQIQIHRDREQP